MMSRKYMIYAALVVGLLLLNTGRLIFDADPNDGTADMSEQLGLVDVARFELVGLSGDRSGTDEIVRNLFAPVQPETAPIVEAPKQPALAAPKSKVPSPTELARKLALDELEKFKLAGVVVKDSEITAMLIKEDNYYAVKAGGKIGKDLLIQEITFNDVVLVNEEWGVERILTIENLQPIGKD